MGYPNSIFDGGNLDMPDHVKFVNDNIANFCAKYLVKTFHLPNNFLYLNYLFISVSKRYDNLNNMNLGIENQHITFVPINVNRLN